MPANDADTLSASNQARKAALSLSFSILPSQARRTCPRSVSTPQRIEVKSRPSWKFLKVIFTVSENTKKMFKPPPQDCELAKDLNYAVSYSKHQQGRNFVGRCVDLQQSTVSYRYIRKQGSTCKRKGSSLTKTATNLTENVISTNIKIKISKLLLILSLSI